MRILAAGIRDAARIYARDVREPGTVNELHDEIKRLHEAAEQRQYERGAEMLAEEFSTRVSDLLNGRGARLGIGLPPPEALRDEAQREAACSNVARLCRIGADGMFGLRPENSLKPAGAPVLYAPKRSPHFPKRSAERTFVMNLRLAWLEAVGEPPTATVNPARSDRPFAKLARECLKLVGAEGTDAVGLINELNRRQRTVEVNSLRYAAVRREYEQSRPC